MSMQPTPEAYAELQQAFEHFNVTLFDGQLRDCLITLQRERRTMGYFANARFVHHSGVHTDEIAMNPGYFAIRPIRDTLSTLVHEMVHAWQAHYGKPGRRCYHNKEWAARMEAIGLMPSDTGEPGGHRVGEQMTQYIIEGGAFDMASQALLTREFKLSWLDRYPPERPRKSGSNDDEDEGGGEGLDLVELPPEEPVNKSNRVKYRCPSCSAQVWGKPNLRVLCGGSDCDAMAFVAQD